MAILTAGIAGSLDIFETAIASSLAYEIKDASSSSLSIIFSNFLDDVKGNGLVYDSDNLPIEGIITSLDEFKNGSLSFSLKSLSLSAKDFTTYISNGEYIPFFSLVFSGSDIIEGGAFNDRIYSFDGDDTIRGGDGDDEIDGGAGSDLIYGGKGDDAIYGGFGLDTAHFDGLFRSYSVSQKDGAFVVTGPDGTDVLEGVERVSFNDGSLIIDPDLASHAPAAQILRLYDAVLQRQPDQIGLDFYTRILEHNDVSITVVASDLMNSAEFGTKTGALSNGAFVDYVYQHSLGRLPDADGKAYYTNLLDKGESRVDLMISFSESTEHIYLTAHAVAEKYFNTDSSYQAVALLYDSFAGRKPDVGGLTYYAELLKSGSLTLAQAANDFAESNEFTQATLGLSNGQLVDYMYRNTLDREADAGGKTYYTTALDNGFSKASLLLDFSQSQEHYNYLASSIIGGIEAV